MCSHSRPMKRPKSVACNGISRRAALALAVAAVGTRPGAARADATVIRVGYIRSTLRSPTISLRDAPARDDGLAGAQLGTDDNATTGRFLDQQFELIDKPVRGPDAAVQAFGELAEAGVAFVLTDLSAPAVLALADAAHDKAALILNVAATDDSLRDAGCRADVVHVAPSRSMLADAVGQYLVWKKWSRWLLVAGSHPDDALLADAYRRAAKRFGARIVAERVSPDTGGARQTDSGLTQVQAQMPVLTQGAPDYDVLIAADENQVFAGYLPYRTWDARPVAGSAGLMPVTWDPSSESWGGAQLQSRFERRFRRDMSPLDMQAWTATRIVGEAASRVASADPAKIIAYIKSPEFGVAAYKGTRLTLRDWNLQLRQPILLSDGRTVVSISPQPGFLHQTDDLDTLGVDRPETRCRFQ